MLIIVSSGVISPDWHGASSEKEFFFFLGGNRSHPNFEIHCISKKTGSRRRFTSLSTFTILFLQD